MQTQTSSEMKKQALAEIYAALLGTGDATAGDFVDATLQELQSDLLSHFQPDRMEKLFQDAFTRGVRYALFKQHQLDRRLQEEDFFAEDGLIDKIDWDEAMLDWC